MLGAQFKKISWLMGLCLSLNMAHSFAEAIRANTQDNKYTARPKNPNPILVEPIGDSDGDGVRDDLDFCGQTEAGVQIDTNGCPLPPAVNYCDLDSDGDGVNDCQDECPKTATDLPVGDNGCLRELDACEYDSDGDGLTDCQDECPNTPKGTIINAQGCVPAPVLACDPVPVAPAQTTSPNLPEIKSDACRLDQDKDGIADCNDQCQDTPPNMLIGTDGCPLEDSCEMDGDNDNVPDCFDQCVNSAKDSEVNVLGCALSGVAEKAVEKVPEKTEAKLPEKTPEKIPEKAPEKPEVKAPEKTPEKPALTKAQKLAEQKRQAVLAKQQAAAKRAAEIVAHNAAVAAKAAETKKLVAEKAAAQKIAEQKVAAEKAAKPAEIKPAEKPSEAKSPETTPTDPKPVEPKPTVAKPIPPKLPEIPTPQPIEKPKAQQCPAGALPTTLVFTPKSWTLSDAHYAQLRLWREQLSKQPEQILVIVLSANLSKAEQELHYWRAKSAQEYLRQRNLVAPNQVLLIPESKIAPDSIAWRLYIATGQSNQMGAPCAEIDDE